MTLPLLEAIRTASVRGTEFSNTALTPPTDEPRTLTVSTRCDATGVLASVVASPGAVVRIRDAAQVVLALRLVGPSGRTEIRLPLPDDTSPFTATQTVGNRESMPITFRAREGDTSGS